MANRGPREVGPTAQRLAANVKQVRAARGLDLAHLAERLQRIGQPIGLSGLSRLENGERRVDVDDLLALAVALDVSPVRLLLPAHAGSDDIELTPRVASSSRSAWEWASGDSAPTRDLWGPPGPGFSVDRFERFKRENAPHREHDDMDFREVIAQQDALRPVVESALAAEEAGVPWPTIVSYLEAARAWQPTPREDDGQRS